MLRLSVPRQGLRFGVFNNTFEQSLIKFQFQSLKFNSTNSSSDIHKADSNSNTSLDFQLEKQPIYLVAVPVTSEKTFLYCKYSNDAKPFKGQKEPFDSKLIGWANTAWNKFEKSENKINQKILSFVNTMLKKIPWDETSMRSIPSKSTIARFLKDEYHEENQSLLKKYSNGNEENINEKDYKIGIPQKIVEEQNFHKDHLEDIPIFYPSGLLSKTRLIDNLLSISEKNYQYHLKYLIISLIVLPITLPVALVPVVPNVPGFYVAYRAWCHFSAIQSIDHLNYLLGIDKKSGNKEFDLQRSHLKFIGLSNIEQIYLNVSNNQLKTDISDFIKSDTPDGNNKEKILIDEESVKNICEVFNIKEAESILLNALEQEKIKEKKKQQQQSNN